MDVALCWHCHVCWGSDGSGDCCILCGVIKVALAAM
jgi:hypothetical protein